MTPRSAAVTPATVAEHIAAGRLDPCYLVLGDDDVEKLELAGEFEQIVDEGLRAFNVSRFHGGDAAVDAIVDAVRTMPMMVPRRVVIVTRVERLLEPARESRAAMQNAESLLGLLDDPLDHVVLVLVATSLDERRKLTRTLFKRATVVRCGVVETLADVTRWIRGQVKAAGRTMTPAAVQDLAARTGPDLRRLRGELNRVLLYASTGTAVTESDVDAVCGPSVAQDDWAVARAIERRDTGTALQELARTLDGGAVPYLVLAQLAWVARAKVAAPQTRVAIDAVFRTDLALKRSRGEARVLLERLVVELCGGGAVGRPAWSGRR